MLRNKVSLDPTSWFPFRLGGVQGRKQGHFMINQSCFRYQLEWDCEQPWYFDEL